VPQSGGLNEQQRQTLGRRMSCAVLALTTPLLLTGVSRPGIHIGLDRHHTAGTGVAAELQRRPESSAEAGMPHVQAGQVWLPNEARAQYARPDQKQAGLAALQPFEPAAGGLVADQPADRARIPGAGANGDSAMLSSGDLPEDASLASATPVVAARDDDLVPATTPTAQADTSARPEEAANGVYQDQYLLDADESAYELQETYAAEPFGRRWVDAELIYYNSADDFLGDDVEQGGRLRWRRETRTWGTMDAEVQIVDVDSTFLGRQMTGSEAVFTLRQSAMPVSDLALLDTTVGHQRSRIQPLLHGSYRHRLPTSPMVGVSGELTHLNKAIRFATGKVGSYGGVALPRFEATGGALTTLASEIRINDQLEIGGQLTNLGSDDDIRDHSSLLIGARYTDANGRQEHAPRLLVDNDGNLGFWLDSHQEFGFGPALNYGAFYADPNLVWADLQIPNDQMGLYLRADASNRRYSLAAGYDYLETGLGSAPASASQSHALFFSSRLRVRRLLSVGLTADLAQRHFTGSRDEEQLIWSVNAFTSVTIPLGTLRFELFANALDSLVEANGRDRTGIRTEFDWRMPERVRLSTELRMERDQGFGGEMRRDELSVLYRYDLFQDISLGLNASVYSARGDLSAGQDGIGVNADLRWAFLPNWYASVSVNHNRAELDVTEPDVFARPETSGNRSLWLKVGYGRASGQAYPMFGRAQAGRAGTGSITGEVFFDENRDSIRQPGERVARGAVVLLDGRYETRTDEQGRFTFSPVPTGPHEVRVLTEELPLPWGLDDESPQQVRVDFRQAARVEFALVVLR
jgi:hypothetical protein